MHEKLLNVIAAALQVLSAVGASAIYNYVFGVSLPAAIVFGGFTVFVLFEIGDRLDG